ncbi:MAG: response regulator transcription factor, partial [Bacteroidetes bacterium]|nr:response regulator transcription factor [Bacteroidota bacterium]
KAIRYSALDYLLKPLSEEELRQAIQRYKNQMKSAMRQQQFNMLFDNIRNISDSYSKITVSTLDGIIFLNVNEIIYCESESSYTTFYMRSGEKIVSSKTMKEFEELLPLNLFFRIHHSYIVNLNEIKRYVKGEGGSVILNNQVELPVSKRKKEEFLKKLKLS